MNVNEALKHLQASEIFKKWHEEHEEPYLAHAFLMFDPNVKNEWQIGYYSPKKDTITSFVVGEEIAMNPESEVFKEKGIVKELDMEDVHTPMRDALSKANALQKEKYRQYAPIKKIIILQHLDMGTVWNISFVTASFNTLNIKVDAKKGDIVSHDLVQFFTGLD